MSEVVLRDKSGHPILAVRDDGFSIEILGQTLPQVVGSARVVGAVAALPALVVLGVPHSGDQSYEIGANLLVTTATTHAFTMTVAYTDEGGTARTLTLTFGLVAGGVAVTSIANANGAVPYHGVPVRIRAKKGTTITIATVGTFTAVAYNAEAVIALVA